jgi:CRISPR-associated endonuclease/helicase Cas3
VILIATQVAEMSLDLSADLLITDIAPVSSLIQRMGRLNRRATPDKPGEPKPALICQLPAENEVLPYKKEDLKVTATWIQNLLAKNKSLSQRDLAEEFVAVSDEEDYNYKTAQERACFFGVPKKSGLWRTRPGSTRGEGYTIPVILKADYEAWQKQGLSGNPNADWIRKHEVAIPIRKEALKWEQIGGIRIAPKDAAKTPSSLAIRYSFDVNPSIINHQPPPERFTPIIDPHSHKFSKPNLGDRLN